MPDLILSVSNNILKASVLSKEGLLQSSVDVSPEIVDQDGSINNTQELAQAIFKVVEGFTAVKKRHLQLVYLLQPSQSELFFVTSSKNQDSLDTFIIEEAKNKLTEDIDSYYFAYKKIAPFVYQFIAVKKQLLDSILGLSLELKMPLKAVLPWVLLLPKFMQSNDPAVFISTNGTSDEKMLALAELNGIYHVEEKYTFKDAAAMNAYIDELRVFKKASPINRLYLVDGEDDSKLESSFEVSRLLELDEDFAQAKGYEVHLMAESMLKDNPELLQTQVNALNLLPLPAVSRSLVPVYAGVAMSAAVVLLVVSGYVFLYRPRLEASRLAASNTDNAPTVLSQETQTNDTTQGSADLEDEDAIEDLNKEDIVLRVENGAGIAGLASQTRATLEELGYKVEGIGDSDKSGLETTTIQIKESKKAYASVLEEDLQDEFTVEILTDLPEDSEYDVLITLGSN
ncbi:LytR C-terminal domain-containing protein [Candidatus Nomurabacteria bacterium]|uniref:LytR C-terminal domain-containing protein n=1 Tax=candidate division WWE3 bacterium TaxID=2053526 RepID=A0A955E0A4_UNCKA|nr:LytR C-terminal domain-containing protein [candidate division WWE3 bacterium]MCB9824089.1 LytR C-terminal domain-containing protein [Candidatus Nomurabacteria bacterium]MCB9826940.1 LytR C-terminal domain-containing protein [Candidatus Nomurabacteria bacterium]MCB9828030.1 LytR C-terminal domain-containing protein [Candidatus Nomurabacteria bacterium]HXK52538.1 LytR C-terminal domain-containing protein [bacterium]